MQNAAPLLFILCGALLIWLGITGRLGVFLAALFTPSQVSVSDS